LPKAKTKSKNAKGRPPRAVALYHPLITCNSGILSSCFLVKKCFPENSMRHPPNPRMGRSAGRVRDRVSGKIKSPRCKIGTRGTRPVSVFATRQSQSPHTPNPRMGHSAGRVRDRVWGKIKSPRCKIGTRGTRRYAYQTDSVSKPRIQEPHGQSRRDRLGFLRLHRTAISSRNL
jgi:hypothetical protein